MVTQETQPSGIRTYTRDGIVAPSVTSIVEHAERVAEPLQRWRDKNLVRHITSIYGLTEDEDDIEDNLNAAYRNADDISFYYTSIGVQLHNHAEGNNPENLPTNKANIALAHACRAYDKFRNDWQITDTECEIVCFGDMLHGAVAGTADLWAKKNDRHILFEIKTSRFVLPWHAMQASAYAHLLRQMGYTIDEVYILQISKWSDEDYHTYKVDEETALSCFNSKHHLFLYGHEGLIS